jgi:hypothetical protein
MKTNWGRSNHRAGTIRLNTDLAKKSSDCLEYILVHETVHLLELTHNFRFIELMNWFLPNWQSYIRFDLCSHPSIKKHPLWRCQQKPASDDVSEALYGGSESEAFSSSSKERGCQGSQVINELHDLAVRDTVPLKAFRLRALRPTGLLP